MIGQCMGAGWHRRTRDRTTWCGTLALWLQCCEDLCSADLLLTASAVLPLEFMTVRLLWSGEGHCSIA